MSAVVGQEAIAAFAQPRARPLHHLVTVEVAAIESNPDLMAVREAFERNFFHRSGPQSVGEAGVVDDAPLADVDAVVGVEAPR